MRRRNPLSLQTIADIGAVTSLGASLLARSNAPKGPINWREYEAKAARMSDAELTGALSDIQRTLRYARELDEQDGGDREGFYLDEASIYRKEQGRRFDPRRRNNMPTYRPYANLTPTMHRSSNPYIDVPITPTGHRTGRLGSPNPYSRSRKRTSYRKKSYGKKSYRKSYRKYPSRKYSSKSASTPHLVKIYDKAEQIFATGSVNSGSYGVRRSDRFTHKFTSRPAIYGVTKSGTYFLPSGAIVLKGTKWLFKTYGPSGATASGNPGSRRIAAPGAVRRMFHGFKKQKGWGHGVRRLKRGSQRGHLRRFERKLRRIKQGLRGTSRNIPASRKWIQRAHIKKGALRMQLKRLGKLKGDGPIPVKVLQWAKKQSAKKHPHLARRAQLALKLRKYR